MRERWSSPGPRPVLLLLPTKKGSPPLGPAPAAAKLPALLLLLVLPLALAPDGAT